MGHRPPRTLNPSGRPYEVGPGGLGPADFARWYIDSTRRAWDGVDAAAVGRFVDVILSARRRGSRVFVMGNGGSAATASHMATDFAKTAAVPGRPLIDCQSLTDNAAFMTAIGNDIGYDALFSRQMENSLSKGDVVVLISGSGNSRNMLEAAKLARARKATVVALLGFDGGRLKALADVAVLVPSAQYGIIEDFHMAIGHIVAFYMWQERSK